LKKFDPDMYDYLSRVGVGVLPDTAIVAKCALSPWFVQTSPSRGAFFLWEGYLPKRKGVLTARFVYFNKYSPAKAPPRYERINNGVVYEVTVFWDKSIKELGNRGFGGSFAVQVDDAGQMRLLREKSVNRVRIRAKKGRDRGRTFSITQHQCGFPAFVTEWIKDEESRWKDPQQLAAELLSAAAGFYEAAHASMIRVQAKRADVVLTIAVNVKRTPYFFRDRDAVVDAKGKKKRIFHSVRPHVRSNGQAVRLHFRGLREFTWNGYPVSITVPGKHHLNIEEFNVGGLEDDAPVAPGERLTSRDVGEILQRHVAGKDFRAALEDVGGCA
jgi:hypothetical protein